MNKVILITLLVALGSSFALAQSGAEEEKEFGWFDTAELSLVLTEGNSDTATFAFKNTLTRKWEDAELRLFVDGMRADTSDDRFLLADAGQTFLPGESPTLAGTTVVKPPIEPDAEKYFVEGRYTKQLGGRRSWNTGASWDRNEDAGILNRYIAFGGIGNKWKTHEKLVIETSYGLSYTDREEETPDPEKEDAFAGVRLTTDLDYQVAESTLLGFDFTGNLNAQDTGDYSIDTTASVSVSMSKRVALKFSAQLLYNSEPALEDVDIVVRFDVIDPDGVPGNGDEFFLTVTEGGAEVEIGEGQARKDELDTVFRSSVVINF